jgi:hypothetical protein
MRRDDDLKELRFEEERRGKRPIDLAARKRRLLLLRKFREALQSGDEEKFKAAIIEQLGQLPGTAEFENSLKIWRRYRSSS